MGDSATNPPSEPAQPLSADELTDAKWPAARRSTPRPFQARRADEPHHHVAIR